MKLEQLIKYIPLGTIALTLISGIKLAIYYGQFNIQIFDFVELNEIITLFFDDIIYYLTISSMVLVIYLILSTFTNFRISSKPNKDNFDYESKGDNTLNKYMNFTGIMAIVILIVLSTLVYLSTYSLYLKITLIEFNIFSFLTLGLVVAAHKGWIKGIKSAFILYFGIITIGLLASEAFLESEEIKSNNTNQSFNIRTPEKVYNNDKFSYIGKTNNYFFLYDKTKHTSLILPISKLELFNLKR